MRDEFSQQFTQLLVCAFRNLLKIEEQSVQSGGRFNLSISEMHLLDSVSAGGPEGRTVSDIAADLKVTLPSVTAAVKKLEKRGFVYRQKSQVDKRVVYIFLTKLGLKALHLHQYFHENMVRAITEEFSDEERAILMQGVTRINDFFERKIRQQEEQPPTGRRKRRPEKPAKGERVS